MRHVMQHNVADRTIGVFTFCDKLDGDEDRQLLRGWLLQRPDAKDNVPLEPYGYVATMNKELASRPDESNHARLVRQALKEPAWFRDEGFDEVADWFETLAKAERSHANRYQKALTELVD